MITDEVKGWIQGYLKEEKQASRIRGTAKQRHTAWHIYERLRAEHAFSGSYEAVARVVRELRPKGSDVFIPLAWDPGDAMQADWGQAVVFLVGKPVKVHLFCARLCCSGLPFVTLYPAERNEFLLDGHRRAFEFFQGVPQRVIYDTIQARATRKAWSKGL